MQMSLQCRRAEDRSLGMMMKEIDEDLALFLEIRGRENEKNDPLYDKSASLYDDSTASNPDSSMASGIENPQNTFFLDALENSESDFEWLFSPPFSPSAPSIDTQLPEAPFEVEIPKSLNTDVESEQENTPKETSSSTVDTSKKQPTFRPSNRRSISSGAGKSAARKPLGRPSKPSTSSTLNPKCTSSSSKPMASSKKSLIPSKSVARSTSTPPARSALPCSSKASARSITPTPKISTVSGSTCCPSIDKKIGSKTSRGVSPQVRSRPKVASEVLVSSSNALPNTKFPAINWPSIATKGRSKQKACSPLREKANASYRVSRGYSNSNDDDEVNPVLVGTKMVERVVNMRKLAPPKDDYQPFDDHNKSSLDKSGFGRSLSKKSLDMAIRHMDIRSKVPVNLNRKRVPASSVSNLSSGRVTKTGAFLAHLTSTDSDDSVSSSSIPPDRYANGSYF